jgi:hypothetical protein
MPPKLQIMCINKTDRSSPHERITHVGGVIGGRRWRMSQTLAIQNIELGIYDFYVLVQNTAVAVLVARTAAGHKYLKTTADGEHANNLLSLPECL